MIDSTIPPNTLECNLVMLRRFGKVFLAGGSDGTWSCTLEITAQIDGVSTDIRASRCPDPAEAASQCMEKLKRVIQGDQIPRGELS